MQQMHTKYDEVESRITGLEREASQDAPPLYPSKHSETVAVPADTILLRLGGEHGNHGISLKLGSRILRSATGAAELAGGKAYIGSPIIAVDGKDVQKPADVIRLLTAAAKQDNVNVVSIRFGVNPAK